MENKLIVENEDILEDNKIIIKTDNDTFYMNILYTIDFNGKNYVLLYSDENEDEIIPMEYDEATKELHEIDENDEDLMNYLNEVLEAIDDDENQE